MWPILQIGPVALQWPGLVLLAGVWLATLVIEHRAVELGQNADALSNLILAGLLADVVGARLGHAAQHLTAYLADPAALVALTPATLLPAAGVSTALLVMWISGRRAGVAPRPALAAMAPGLAVFMAVLSLANFFSGDAFGTPTDLPWAINLWGAWRHPTQLYEMTAAGLVAAVVWRGPLARDQRGLNFLLAVALLAASRLVFESVRGDSVSWAGGWRAAQIGALGMLGVALAGMRLWLADPRPAGSAADADSLNFV